VVSSKLMKFLLSLWPAVDVTALTLVSVEHAATDNSSSSVDVDDSLDDDSDDSEVKKVLDEGSNTTNRTPWKGEGVTRVAADAREINENDSKE